MRRLFYVPPRGVLLFYGFSVTLFPFASASVCIPLILSSSMFFYVCVCVTWIRVQEFPQFHPIRWLIKIPNFDTHSFACLISQPPKYYFFRSIKGLFRTLFLPYQDSKHFIFHFLLLFLVKVCPQCCRSFSAVFLLLQTIKHSWFASH